MTGCSKPLRSTLLAALLVVGADLRAALPSSAAAPHRPRITLGLIAPPTEPDAASIIHGAQLAVADANGADHSRVALEIRSEAGQWGSVGNDAVLLVNERYVDALITSADGADSHLILQVSGRTHTPVATLCSDMSVTRAGIPWAVRIVPGNDRQASALFTATRNSGGSLVHWWVVAPSGRPARALRHDLDFAAGTTAAVIDRMVEIDGKTSAKTIAKTIAGNAPPGVLLWVNPAQAGTLAAELRAAGYRGRLAGPCTLDSPQFRQYGNAATSGLMIPVWHTDPRSAARAVEFDRAYRARFGVAPDFIATASHDAVRVLLEALRDTAPEQGYRAFPVTIEILGVTGAMHFDSAGNRIDALEVAPLSPP